MNKERYRFIPDFPRPCFVKNGPAKSVPILSKALNGNVNLDVGRGPSFDLIMPSSAFRTVFERCSNHQSSFHNPKLRTKFCQHMFRSCAVTKLLVRVHNDQSRHMVVPRKNDWVSRIIGKVFGSRSRSSSLSNPSLSNNGENRSKRLSFSPLENLWSCAFRS